MLETYEKPFLVTYINNSFFVTNLLVKWFTELWRSYGPKWQTKPIFYEEDRSGDADSARTRRSSFTLVGQAPVSSTTSATVVQDTATATPPLQQTQQHHPHAHIPTEGELAGATSAIGAAAMLSDATSPEPHDSGMQTVVASREASDRETNDIELASVTSQSAAPSYRQVLIDLQKSIVKGVY